MNRKGFNGKAIYNPQGKAGEYSEWACNFYTGCSNNCDYCYCKKGFMGKTWNEVPQLKKCFTDTQDALMCFVREMEHNIEQLCQVGVFFTFTSDPMLPETKQLTWAAIKEALMREVPVQILTKRADFLGDPELEEITPAQRKRVAFGFTLTGHDELEPGADTNMMRVAAMVDLHSRGFYTFASIEPVVDFVASTSMINLTRGACDLYKIGCMSGKRYTRQEQIEAFYMLEMLKEDTGSRFYLKESLIKLLNIDRADLPEHFVEKDFNIFSLAGYQYGVCRVCGCTQHDPCFNPDHGYCGWADSSHTLCDFCANPDLRDSEHTIHCVNTKGYGCH